MTKKRILLVNDDGYQSLGLLSLKREFEKDYDVTIVAPLSQRSGFSHAITLAHPLRLYDFGSSVYAVDGSPADCVMIALFTLMKDNPPDFVVSGINHGVNMGNDTIYSGTVGAAMEGTVNGVKAIAMSLAMNGSEKPDRFAYAAKIARKFVAGYDLLDLDKNELLNINVPDLDATEILGIRTAVLGKRYYQNEMWERSDPRGERYFWVGPCGHDFALIESSDAHVLSEGYVAVSVLQASYYSKEKTEGLSTLVNRFSLEFSEQDLLSGFKGLESHDTFVPASI